VWVVPTLSLVGAAGFAPWSAVTEGQRSLAKAAARAWGPHAVRVNCVAVPAALAADPGTADAFDREGQPAPALSPPAVRVEVATVVHALISPAWRSVTGTTIGVDGGVWMTP
jgi:NAD(P)-dependent dehydrogenase (short-subunit alcohol dehydrogenase family)